MIVAIDGLSGVGKSTATIEVAKRLNMKCMDTGAIFRSIAYKAIHSGISPDDPIDSAQIAKEIDLRFEYSSGEVKPSKVIVDGEDVSLAIREPKISDGASRISVWHDVRNAVLEIERKTAQTENFVVEGRDIGTVVFPDAELKVFLTAKTETRAKRRLDQYALNGSEAAATPLDEVIRQIEERDERDSTRATAPCIPAPDAVIIATDDLTLEDVIERICQLARERGI